MLVRRASALALLPLLALLAAPAGCAASAPGPGAGHNEGEGVPGEATGTTAEAISSDDALSRAQQWVDAKLLYCQSPNGKADPDTACPSTCTREKNSAWDPYRSDCSGFISWAWGLAAPGLVTGEFAPFDTSVSKTIQATDLQPGDACNKTAGGHIVLFVSWVTQGKSAVFMEEPGCSASPDYAHQFTSDVTLSGVNIDIAYEGESFTAIRFDQLTQSAPDAGTGASDAGSAPGDAATADAKPGEDSGTASGKDSGAGSSSSSSSSGGSSSSGAGGSSSGGAASSGAGGSSGASGHDGGSTEGNGAGAGSDVTMDNNGGGVGCDVSGVPAREGGASLGLLVLGLALVRRRSASGRS